MKWFKHFSDASDDEKLSEVLCIHGPGAYGVFWLIVEAVAAQMDKTDRCFARYHIKKWATITHVDRRTLTRYLQTFSILTLIVQQDCDNFVTISIPKLLNLRDNYTKDLQVTTRKTSKQEVDVEEEVEEDKPKHKYVEEDLRLAEWMFSLILTLDENAKKPNLDKWADTVRLMVTRDNHTRKEIASVFKWANGDTFWKKNILSPTKLREKFSQLKITMNSNEKPKQKASIMQGINDPKTLAAKGG